MIQARPLHLEAGADIRRSLEQFAKSELGSGFVLSVVGNMSQACFACPGRSEPTVLRGELEIITLQGTVGPSGVHLHLSFSDADCQVWGGHLEHGSLVLKGADLLVGLLTSETPSRPAAVGASAAARVQIAVAEGCPWSQRALRMLRSLGIRYELVSLPEGSQHRSLPQVSIDGEPIGGYSELAELHGSGALEQLRLG